ncbi:hypothetical protein ABB37_00236 [Leptomonas pyrrhocoris]|uniref:Uncharacterized protein n=1 Tax=Leptomonas pyrrhocoris TaxID=157538 RepID=A0A0N0VHK6_LEPPY|nr:hypothetical protein ABB37_00236 [Leptomonas pyrrhocoris]KPA85934.1 hypothetical protein ABB37_00236 [Leptomonas pyrrhocoris]|eukprot:XP_015664373.1 hypothetical protein ABB37_00236 [Leptomonas pyrrhocoris]
MPPKRKGHTLRGKQKVFRHAVEHVRLGLGHTVLGNLNLGLAASAPSAVDIGSTIQRPAFYVELNEQLLSHSSKDFKKFRWEVLELCETVPLLQLHHRQLAQKLLARLMDRGTHRVGEEEDNEEAKGRQKNTRRKTPGGADEGATTQAYEAFARLTIAFVRDMGSKFLPYYQIFQQSMQAGMYDQSGHLIVDTARLQLVFAVQAAWCRELHNCWDDPAQLPLVRRIIQQYVGQLHDTKEYVRRLSAELLAFLCRLCRPLLPLVVEEACGDVLRAYEETATEAAAAAADDRSDDDSAGEQEDKEGEEEDEDADSDTPPSATSSSSSIWTDSAQLLDFTRSTLPHHPVVDGLVFFAAELFRGMRGALSSSFETHYVRLLYAFHLMELDDTTEEKTKTVEAAADGRKEAKNATPARSTVNVVRALHHQRHPLAPLLDDGDDNDTDAGNSGSSAKDAAVSARGRRNADLHTTRWSAVFDIAGESNTTVQAEAVEEEEEREGTTLSSSADIAGARRLLRHIGSHTLGSAAAAVLRETKRQSLLLSHAQDSSTDEEDDEEVKNDQANDEAAAHSSVRPSHRVLTAVVMCLRCSAGPASASYVQILVSVMSAANFALWVDSREAPLLKQLAKQLLSLLKPRSSAEEAALRFELSVAVDEEGFAARLLESAAVVLRLLLPLCLSPYLGASPKRTPTSDHLLELQQWFVPVAKAAVQACVKVATAPPHKSRVAPEVDTACQPQEKAEQILFAFAQDVAQKNYAFAMEQERRIAEEADVRGIDTPTKTSTTTATKRNSTTDFREDAYVSGEEEGEEDAGETGTASNSISRPHKPHRAHHQVPSLLTPFALTLLHTIGTGVWQRATEDLQRIAGASSTPSSSVEAASMMVVAFRHANVQRAVLLSRLLQDHTQHMAVSPLQQMLRLKAISAAAGNAEGSRSAAAATVDKTASARGVLEKFVLGLLQYYKTAQSTGRSSSREASEAMSYVSCALPLIQLLVSAPATTASSASAPVKSALLELLQSIEAREDESHDQRSDQNAEVASPHRSLLDPAAYALYAEVAAMLVQLTAGLSGGRRSSSSTKLKKNKGTLSVATSGDMSHTEAEQEGLRHLCRTVAVLVHGFRQLRASPDAAGEADLPAAATNTTSTAVSDDTRVQLLHGAEVLLHALLWMLGLDSESQHYDEAQETLAAAAAGGGEEVLSAHTKKALSTLHAALPASLHASFVQHVLLECVTAPIAGLRLHALRLLRLLCHPSLTDAHRLVGAPAVPLDILDALLRAAEFNPLSHRGNLDGMQQALSRLSFKVESGAVTKTFERVLIARTVIGFLYIKFTGAWETASKLLCWLVAQEETSMAHARALPKAEGDNDGKFKENDKDETNETEDAQPRRKRLEPVVWNSVICVYARSLILGDVVAGTTASTTAASAAAVGGSEEQRAEEELEGNAVAADGSDALAVAVCGARLAELPCLYEIRPTDQQRHAKGKLVSRAFSSAQYSTSSFTLLESTNDDFEVVRWGQHWTASSRQQVKKNKRGNNSSLAAAALYATSTDRSTLAQTFLSILEAMVKTGSAVDRKVRLVEDVVLELAAVERNRHPSGIDASQVRRLDQRLEVAMRACAAAPTGVLTASQRKRLSDAAQHDIDGRNAELQAIFVSYVSEVNPRLQRAAVDNLKRLRVEPYSTYHGKLTPYCDTMKALFAFLSTFHVESDVPSHDRVSYVSAALSLALPKLLAKVSKDKLKDQAVLSRRLMGYLEHLPPQPTRIGAAKDPLAEVLDQLLHRLLAFAMPIASAPSASSGRVDSYDFLTNVWEGIVYGGCGLQPPSSQRGDTTASNGNASGDVRRRSGLHGIRRLERLMKQLSSALRLLEAMLHAVGQRFSVYVSTCLHLALQSYLVACKQCLRHPMDALMATLSTDAKDSAATPGEERVRRWLTFLNKSLASSTLSTALSHVRRAAVSIVALLSEQFPEEVMDTVRDCNANDTTAPAFSLFATYLRTLFDNSKGTTLDGDGRPLVAGGLRLPSSARSSVTPVLRLLMAWVRSPALLPLFPAFAGVVVGTLDEIFAVNAAATSVHKASTQAIFEGLRCVSEMLSCADEEVVEMQFFDGAIIARPCARCATARKTTTLTTFRKCFLEQHIVGVFTSLYTLLTSGAAREEAEVTTMSTTTTTTTSAAMTSSPNKSDVAEDEKGEAATAALERRRRVPSSQSSKGRKSSSTTSNNAAQREGKRRPTSIMSLSVSVWREVMRTVSQLTQFLRTDAAASTSSSLSLDSMIGRLLELALKMVAHPVCMFDASTAQMVTGMTQTLMEQVRTITYREHWQPLVRLFNVVPNPQARHSLCALLSVAVEKLPLPESSNPLPLAQRHDESQQAKWFHKQLAATARAVKCLNSFEKEDTFDRYDFELRYHTLHSLHDFFAHFGNYGALPRGRHSSSSGGGNGGGGNGSTIRRERAYEGAEDVQLSLDKVYAPVLVPEAVAVLAANVMFFLRDPEQTIRALVLPLLQSMVRYASLGGQRLPGTSEGRSSSIGGGHAKRSAPTQAGEADAVSAEQNSAARAAQQAYRTQVLETILRHEVLGSLRRGVVAKDVHIRCAHMQAFEGFARYFGAEFPSFALLYSPNTEQNFYANVGHVQHRSRLHALALLRQHAAEMNVRDVLRVFVPFTMSAVKDFAEGKRNQANLTEGRARGYCDAVLLTISSIAARLPWTAYYRVLSLFLSNASANANLRATMLRGVVQVLNTFHFLEDNEEKEGDEAADGSEAGEDEDEVNDADDAVRAELTAKQREFRHAKVMRVLEADVLPQLYSYLGDKESKSMTGKGLASQHSITTVRREQQREDAASAQMKNALLQLPVAMAITKIVKHFPEDRFNVHVDHLLDELIKKLRTKNDKHRDSARRILGAMLQETGPSKLKFVVTKLKDNLVHGYQLHVLGYTVVTLLYQLYEPNSQLLHPHQSKSAASFTSHARGVVHDPAQEALEEAMRQKRSISEGEQAPRRARLERDTAGKDDKAAEAVIAVDEDAAVEQAEEALLRELGTSTHADFDFQYGVDCLTKVMEDLLLIFLDDYLGEVGIQKEQVEVMSTMVEVKRNRALQGFAFLGKHCDAATVMEAFLHRITWVLTPPSDNVVSTSELHGSARVRSLLAQEMKSKYLTVGKGGSVDLVFVNKVRLLAVRVARSLMTNPTMSVEKSFEQVRRSLEQHNRTREEKVRDFEAKDGTRRIRGNAHLILHKADRHSRKEQLDQNFLVAAVPERVDADFSAHTVLATQQKQKLRVYRGRYGKEVKEAAKNFYREDPVTAVVLDTLDEFLLKFLLSVLKQVLGIGKEKHYSKAAMKLDMLRHHREQQRQRTKSADEDEGEAEDNGEAGSEQTETAQEGDGAAEDEEEETAAVANDDGDEDGLGAFAEAQTVAEGETATSQKQRRANKPTRRASNSGDGSSSTSTAAALLAPGSDLTVTFTHEHRSLLESLVSVVLTCLQGEGSDAVVANALDCLLALVSLRPPLNAVNDLQKELFETVTSFIERGSVIKQRAIRLTAAMVAHQKYVVSEANAVQLVKLVRAEVMERNEFMSVSLSLLYAILGKHVHIAEVYDLMDVITELLLHWSAHRTIRRRCILILTRFLLEYRLTPEKFKSHIDMYCRNLDYPELTGRTALLELLDALIVRLPAVILRDEAPVLLVPLAATVTGSEWVECRRQGGAVLQHLARYAGVDVLVPVLSAWMAAAQPRATRSMAVQTWATIVPALSEFYELSGEHQQQGADDDGGDAESAAAREENRAAFQACCAWSLETVLEGCLYDQLAASGRNKRLDQLSSKAKEKVELEGWAYVFYSLRATEAMLTALPEELYPLLAPRLLPHITDTLMIHAHPWVRAAATRILRHYLYTFVERRCRYLQEDVWHHLATQTERLAGHHIVADPADSNETLLYMFDTARCSAKTAIADAMKTLQTFASTLRRVLGLVSASDVTMEMYNAHRAIADPARGELLKIAVYVLRAMADVSLFVLTQTGLAAAAATTASAAITDGAAPSSAPPQRRLRAYQDVQQRVRTTYVALQHQLHSLITPVVQQNSLVNYMVRSATLIQLLGGWISVLPHEASDEDEEGEGDARQLHDTYNAQVRWMSQQLLCPTTMLQQCTLPLLALGLRAKPISEKVSLIAYQVTTVVEQQLEERRHELTTPTTTHIPATDADVSVGKKRQREERKKDAAELGEENSYGVPFDDVLVSLKTQLANIHDARRDQQVVLNAKKAQKRSRRQMEMESRQQQRRKGRPLLTKGR